MFEIKSVIKQATEEVQKEKTEALKERLKAKLREIEKAKEVLKNLESEYNFLISEMT